MKTAWNRFLLAAAAGFVAAAMAMMGAPAAATAATLSADAICLAATATPFADSDGDGVSDYDECRGLNLAGTSTRVYPGYDNAATAGWTSSAADRWRYLDPATKDLFFIVAPAPSGSLLLRAFGNDLDKALDLYSRGLGIAAHRIEAADATPDRVVALYTSTVFQRAVKITESLDSSAASPLGETWQGTPNGQDGSKIYTKRIEASVAKNCPSTVPDASCRDISGVSGKVNVVDLYIREVVSHEAGHASGLAPAYSRSYEWHYAPQSAVIMEPSMKVVTNGTKSTPPTTATFYIMTGFKPDDAPAARISGGY